MYLFMTRCGQDNWALVHAYEHPREVPEHFRHIAWHLHTNPGVDKVIWHVGQNEYILKKEGK